MCISKIFSIEVSEPCQTNKEEYRKKLIQIFNANKKNYQRIHKKIQPFAIYFPQFHEFPENNINFYPGFTDFVNLKKLVDKRSSISDYDHILTPLKNWVDYYDLIKDEGKIEDQILTAKAYGIAGFALYHYWFDRNDKFPGKNKVMNDVVDKIFSREHEDFKFFFIWPSADWTPWLKNEKISQNIHIDKHFKDLIAYFKHKNYYKIDNKPVFLILDAFSLKKSLWDKLLIRFQKLAIKAGFSGIYTGISFDRNKELSEKADAHFFPLDMPWGTPYIHNDGSKFVVDYDFYLTAWEEERIHAAKANLDGDFIFYLFPRFDNAARRFEYTYSGDMIATRNRATMFNTSHLNFEKHVKKQFDLFHRYKNRTKLFLINAWNEWGENMSLEPSNEDKFKNLECFQENLTSYFL